MSGESPYYNCCVMVYNMGLYPMQYKSNVINAEIIWLKRNQFYFNENWKDFG